MVSFSCENCGDILTKKKLDPHRNQCYGASFTCIDCMVHFQGTSYRAHTSCMSEAQKYQGHLYRGEKKKGPQPKQNQALVPHQPTFDHANAGTVAVVDVPPKAPSPPPASDGLPPGVNVFDFLVKDSSKPAALPAARVENGYTYGAGPVEPSFERYDSYNALPDIEHATPLVTPGPKRDWEDKKSDKKRKRENMDVDTTRAKHVQDHDNLDAPHFHTGLTGGLNRMLSGPDFSGEEAETPLNPDKKRSKKDKADKKDDKRKTSSSTTKTSSSRRHETEEDRSRESRRKHRRHRDSSSSEDDEQASRRHVKAIEYNGTSAEPQSNNQMVTYRSPAELFLSFVNKGPDSERGLSINKALKRYHSEQRNKGDRGDDKDLWKGLRVRKNERGEFVLFV